MPTDRQDYYCYPSRLLNKCATINVVSIWIKEKEGKQNKQTNAWRDRVRLEELGGESSPVARKLLTKRKFEEELITKHGEPMVLAEKKNLFLSLKTKKMKR